jgi:pimeloyl-ACP methyl ester carboxylesterase
MTPLSFVHGWKAMLQDGKATTLFKKSGSTIIAIDAPAHGLSSGKEFNIPQYAAYIDILAQNLTLLPHWAFLRRQNLFVLSVSLSK